MRSSSAAARTWRHPRSPCSPRSTSSGESAGYLVGRIDGAGRAVIDRVQIVDGELAVTQPGLLAARQRGADPLRCRHRAFGDRRRRTAAGGRVPARLRGLRARGGRAVPRDRERWRAVDRGDRRGDDRRRRYAPGRRRARIRCSAPRAPIWGSCTATPSGCARGCSDWTAASTPQDDEPYTLIANAQDRETGVVDVQLLPALMPQFGADGFFAIAHVLRGAQSRSPRAFERVRLGCAPK